MERQPIPVEELIVRVVALWGQQRMLFTSGDFAAGEFNTMTVGWGALGRMWSRPLALAVVRPTRYTFQFINNRYDTFTLCAFPENCQPALELLGTRSGRDGDKIAAAGLTPQAATQVAAPIFAEAVLAIECRMLYWDDFHPTQFVDMTLEEHYPLKDYHRILYGEIVAASGTEAYRQPGSGSTPA